MADKIMATIAEIEKRLDGLEFLTYFATDANLRFKKRQRVRLSALAKRKQFKLVRGSGKGTVIEVKTGHSITVLPDGYKKPHTYFHGYWEPVSK